MVFCFRLLYVYVKKTRKEHYSSLRYISDRVVVFLLLFSGYFSRTCDCHQLSSSSSSMTNPKATDLMEVLTLVPVRHVLEEECKFFHSPYLLDLKSFWFHKALTSYLLVLTSSNSTGSWLVTRHTWWVWNNSTTYTHVISVLAKKKMV